MSTHEPARLSTHEPATPSAAFAAHVLRAALGAPGADSPAAAATVLTLLVVLLSEGETAQAERILGVEPGEEASFEVRSYRDGDGGPLRLGSEGAEDAMRKALEQVAAGAELVEVVATAPSGLARRVVESRHGGQLRYLFPAATDFEGDAAAVAAAVSRWEAEASASADIPVAAAASPGWAQDTALTLDMVASTVRHALEEVTVEVDLGPIEAVVAAVGRRLERLEAAVTGLAAVATAGPEGATSAGGGPSARP
ncbi:hypothetical protein K6U06_23995 [Acidiferrimicrobium sp. IK]|uniref:hypothetical protein n=1 Tax=Acidiferrimicrobium sp. IK TaxID=2871700 RepID=UPI0021CB1DA6|nr:hypothetical protein [Acidiferrimicrobium sp. IK]MCU4187441.1 hypothetical protein [Acidiferrimicrobium sp. IK]